jgi:hypothetical protein
MIDNPAPERNQRYERGPQATLGGCADARLTRVLGQCGKTRPRNLSDPKSLGIGRTRTDGLWHSRIAVGSIPEQSYVTEQSLLRGQYT